MKFSIRDLFLVTVIVALAAGWWVDRFKLAREIQALERDPEIIGVHGGILVGRKPIGVGPPKSSAPTPNPPKP
jgi:hypothetical protein